MAAPAAAALFDTLPDPLPDTLDELRAWLAATPSLPGAQWGERLCPVGEPDAPMLVAIGMPEPEEVADQRFLTGDPGALFDRMLGAIGQTRDRLGFMAVSPVRYPSGVIPAADREPLAAIARRYIALARPRIVLVLGDQAAQALLGASVARLQGQAHALPGGTTRAVGLYHPRLVARTPQLRKAAWESLQIAQREGLAE